MPMRSTCRLVLSLAATLGFGGCGSEGGTDEPRDVAACLTEADLSNVEVLDRQRAEEIKSIERAAADATGIVAGTDSEGRPVFVLLFGSERKAREQRERVAEEPIAGARGANVLVLSRMIGPRDCAAIEECFL
jgi:hypothetical protein